MAGGAAHCWSRRGCNFDSGTALFFGLPAKGTTTAAAAAVAGGADAAAAVAEQGSSSSSSGRSPDNPLAAVLQILGQSLDVIPYGPDRTALVFPEGTFRAQVGFELLSQTLFMFFSPVLCWLKGCR